MANLRGQFINFAWTASILLYNMNVLPVSPSQCRPLQVVPGVDLTTYSKMGDINIGVFLPATSSDEPSTCLKSVLSGSFLMEHTEAVAYAVKSVNENPSLLPNTTLGFIQVNDCGNENVALAVALSFLPRLTYETKSLSSCSNNSSSLSRPQTARTDDPQCSEMPYYDIIGAIGPTTSQRTLAVSKLFTSSKIPLIGCLATSDELSDKKRHPFFSRMIPSDKYLIDAVLLFLQSNGWSYTSMVYVKDSYGQRVYDHIKASAPKLGICVATSYRIDDTSDFDDVVRSLKSYPKARVVIIFLYTPATVNLINSVNKSNDSDHFIWILNDSWNTGFRKFPLEIKQAMLGSFSVGLYSTYVPDYLAYLRRLRVGDTTNPWFKAQWAALAGCSLDEYESCDPNFDIFNSPNFVFEKTSSLYIDAVNVFANGVNNLISDRCPNATGNEVRECITGDILVTYLRNVSIEGKSGRIQFDKNGDSTGTYEIRQFVFDFKDIPVPNISSTIDYVAKPVAVYDVETNILSLTDFMINWSYVQVEQSRHLQGYVSTMKVPESVCSKPCGVGEYKLMRDEKCCWDCIMCRDNEKVGSDGTKCELCAILTWPDKNTDYTSCSLIPPTYPLVTDTVPIILICLATVALLCASMVSIGYIYFRDSRVIKAASKELSIAKMVAIFVGYFTVILFQTPPTHGTCGALYFLFCLSFSLIYASLLVKTIRIYRIFQSGKSHNTRPRLISPCSQLVMSGILMGVQMLICMLVYIYYSPTAISTQPILTEKFVELSCHITLPGLAFFLAYNLLLVFLCSIFAFKTRKLPDNFNESRFISMCVSTTLVIWMAFVPTYFTSNENSARVMLLSIALLLNHTVALIFLFVPKIYAAVYVPTDNIHNSRFQNAVATIDMFKQTFPNQETHSPGRNSISL